jgi:nicotinamidase-related amidase
MLNREDCVFLIVDLQEKLIPHIADSEEVVNQTVRLIRFARALDLPLRWTEQYPKGLGATVPDVAEELKGMETFEKTAFGCLGDAAFREALDMTGRRKVVLAGVETHVCVMQTALQALNSGYDVFVARDAVGARKPLQHQTGLERMQAAGAQLVTVEMTMFEILRQAGTEDFKKTMPLLK